MLLILKPLKSVNSEIHRLHFHSRGLVEGLVSSDKSVSAAKATRVDTSVFLPQAITELSTRTNRAVISLLPYEAPPGNWES